MLTILDQSWRCMKRARAAARIATSDDYLRGYIQGLRHHHRVKRFGAQDEHAQWLRFADSPESDELERGYRDGFAGVEPQPWGTTTRKPFLRPDNGEQQMKISATEQPTAAQDQSPGAVAVSPKLTDELVDALAGIAFALACYELAGKEPPHLGRSADD